MSILIRGHHLKSPSRSPLWQIFSAFSSFYYFLNFHWRPWWYVSQIKYPD